jgi:hypothetical protein
VEIQPVVAEHFYWSISEHTARRAGIASTVIAVFTA